MDDDGILSKSDIIAATRARDRERNSELEKLLKLRSDIYTNTINAESITSETHTKSNINDDDVMISKKEIIDLINIQIERYDKAKESGMVKGHPYLHPDDVRDAAQYSSAALQVLLDDIKKL